MSESNPPYSDYMSVFGLGMDAGPVKQAAINGVPYVVIRADSQLVNVENLLPQPVWKRGKVLCDDLLSFARYVKDHRTAATVIFTNVQGGSVAIFDYHHPGETGAAGWCGHRAEFGLRLSDEWVSWMTKSGQNMGQKEFANFLERNMGDVTAPAGADLIELARDLTATVMTEFGSVEHSGGGGSSKRMEARSLFGGTSNVALPERFTLGLPVFKGWSPYKVEALLRANIESKHLQLSYELLHVQKVIDAANLEVQAAVAKETGLTPYAGRVME